MTNKESINLNLEWENLKNELANDIASDFWIDKERVKELITIDTKEWLNALRQELTELKEKTWESISKEKIEKLEKVIEWAKIFIEEASKKERQALIKEVCENDYKSKIEQYLPSELIDKAKNPRLAHEHILWIALWSSNTIISTVEALYQIWKGILKTPYDFYILVSWKWECESIKKI